MTPFNSKNIKRWKLDVSKEHQVKISFAYDVLKLSYRDVIKKPPSSSNNFELVVALAIQRNIQHHNAILKLVSVGMVDEAKIILRSMFETLFLIGAVINKPQETLSQLRSNDDYYRRKMLNKLDQNEFHNNSLGAEKIEIVRTVAASLEGKELKAFDLATTAGLENFYIRYSDLSNNALHANFASISKRISEERGQITGIIVGPNGNEEISDTLGDASLIILNCMDFFFKSFKVDPSEEFNILLSKYNNLFNR